MVRQWTDDDNRFLHISIKDLKMALTEKTEIGSMEVLPMGQIQVRTDTIIERDGVEISRSYHRHVVEPDADISGEDQRVKDIANTVHTDACKKAWADQKKSLGA
jgi:hypothetical protein